MKFGDHRSTGIKNKSSLDSGVGCHRDSVVGLVSKITTGGDKRPTGLSRTWDLLAGDCHSSLSLTANKYRTHSQAEQGWVGLRCFHVNVE